MFLRLNALEILHRLIPVSASPDHYFGLCDYIETDGTIEIYAVLIQIFSVDWTDVYDTHNIEHRTEPVSH